MDCGEDDLLDSDGADGQGAHDAVVDFAGDAELLREGKGDGGDAGEHDGDGHEAGEEDGAESAATGRGHASDGAQFGAADHVRHDVGEDEEEEQRVHGDANEEGEDFAREHAEVALHQAEEGACVGHHFCVAAVGDRFAHGRFLFCTLFAFSMLLTKVSSGKTDEDGFEAGLGGGDVAQAVLRWRW